MTWLNTTILFLLFTAVLAFRYHCADSKQRAATEWHFNAGALRFVPRPKAEEVFRAFLSLSDRELYVKRPWVGFSERTVKLPGITVADAEPLAIRALQGTQGRANERVVWVFGGSTTFGWGVPDDQTIPAHLQRVLQREFPGAAIRVVNHGHVSHFSSQEVLLMQELLRGGQHAAFVVFISGLSESVHDLDVPDFSGMRAPSDSAENADRPIKFSPRFPLVRFWRSLRHRLGGPPPFPQQTLPTAQEAQARAAAAARLFEANVRMARALAASEGMGCLFVWQPTPFDDIAADDRDPNVARIRAPWSSNPVMKPLNAVIRGTPHQDDFLDLTNFFAGRRFLDLYVDSCHYGDRAAAELAEAIGKAIAARWRPAPLR